jgi:hypothetical protein
MADPTPPTRLEPPLGSGPGYPAPPVASPGASPLAELRAAVEGGGTAPASPTATISTPAPPPDRAGVDQLSRIEDKTARIEEKYARSEALLNRVEDRVEKAVARMGEAARGQDMAALRGEVAALDRRLRGVPGFGTLLLVGLLSALIGAGATVMALRFGVPGVMPPIVNVGGQTR